MPSTVAREAWGADVLTKAGLDEAGCWRTWKSFPTGYSMWSIAPPGRSRNCGSRSSSSPRGCNASSPPCGPATWSIGCWASPPTLARKAGRRRPLGRLSAPPLCRVRHSAGLRVPVGTGGAQAAGDPHEEDPISVIRRFGIGQFQPDAHVYARSKRWVVMGMDTASPWNPHGEGPTWSYRLCPTCGLRHNADQPRCPRCKTTSPGHALPSYEFAGFIARQDESPILDEEERYAERNLVSTHPQWDGDVIGRWTVGSDWALRLSQTRRSAGSTRETTDTEGCAGRDAASSPGGQGLSAVSVVREDAYAAARGSEGNRRPTQRQDRKGNQRQQRTCR